MMKPPLSSKTVIMYITEVKLCTITLSCFYFLKKKKQSVSIFKTEIAQENAWKNEMKFKTNIQEIKQKKSGQS